MATTSNRELADRRAARKRLVIGVIMLVVTMLLLGCEAYLGITLDTSGWPFPVQIVLGIVTILPAFAFSVVGLVIVSRQARNVIGWLLCTIGFLFAIGMVMTDFPTYVYRFHHAHGAVLLIPGVIGIVIWAPFAICLAALLLLFPTGRPMPGWWDRILPWGIVLSTITIVSGALAADTLSSIPVHNPIALSFMPGVLADLGFIPVALLLFLGVAAIARRFWISRGEERQQLKWLMYSGALTTVLLCFGFNGSNSLLAVLDVVGYFIAATMMPVTIGIAILKYRLWDIDVLINRTLVYVPLTVALAGFYVSAVLGIQVALSSVRGQSSDLAVAISTLAVVALFRPLRARMQRFIDRRFYRNKYDAAKTLEALRQTLNDELDLDTISTNVIGVVRETLMPVHVSVWLREPPGDA